jgi:hypothetical protein
MPERFSILVNATIYAITGRNCCIVSVTANAVRITYINPVPIKDLKT